MIGCLRTLVGIKSLKYHFPNQKKGVDRLPSRLQTAPRSARQLCTLFQTLSDCKKPQQLQYIEEETTSSIFPFISKGYQAGNP